uniref:Plastid lipid-associated protein/fibrillin conserved domain-containing protein n=1 Tax=Coccolithus braarudii TaxID=221442 RepID=A0A7S0LP74_9EUKA|mmetsp:Transcript_51/g.132  ORF Transcript_51/g.132 Transcript_51/m.132 type:complete len:251 (+) Transcript_51:35-787(+)
MHAAVLLSMSFVGPPGMQAPLNARSTWCRSSVVADLTSPLLAVLFALLPTIPERGMVDYDERRPPTWVAAMEAAVAELEAHDPSGGDWMVDDAFSGRWRLAYTSSPMFRRNRGLSAFGAYVDGVWTPELYLELGPRSRLELEEPLDRESAALLARHLRLPAEEPLPDAVRVASLWAVGSGDSLKLTFEQVSVGSKAWAPANAAERGEVDFEQDKAIRVLGATRPTYLDGSVLVLRALTDAVFVMTREAAS